MFVHGSEIQHEGESGEGVCAEGVCPVSPTDVAAPGRDPARVAGPPLPPSRPSEGALGSRTMQQVDFLCSRPLTRLVRAPRPGAPSLSPAYVSLFPVHPELLPRPRLQRAQTFKWGWGGGSWALHMQVSCVTRVRGGCGEPSFSGAKESGFALPTPAGSPLPTHGDGQAEGSG